MAEQEGKMETSSQTHTPKEATTANIMNPENDLRTAEQTWWRRNHREKGKVAEPQSSRIQAFPHPSPQVGGKGREQGEGKTLRNLHTWPWRSAPGALSPQCIGFWWLVGLGTRESWNTLGGWDCLWRTGTVPWSCWDPTQRWQFETCQQWEGYQRGEEWMEFSPQKKGQVDDTSQPSLGTRG